MVPATSITPDKGTFHSKAEILKLIEQMAAYKLNKLHLHLGDDEGWRLQIASLPDLTAVGAYRFADIAEKTCLQPQLGADPARNAPTNGYLTAADYSEILRAAQARQIAVIPSFDMPGHSRAAIRSMEVRYQRLMAKGDRAGAERYRLVEPGDTPRYSSVQHYDDNTPNVCIDSPYRFIDTVIDDIAGLHKAAGVPLPPSPLGADETAGAWRESPACKVVMAREGLQPPQLGARFLEGISAALAKGGIAVAGWSDGLGHPAPARMPAKVQTNIWSNLHGGGVAEAHGQANRGWKTVLSIPDLGYFDMPYAADPDETGYDWASRGVDSFQGLGVIERPLAALREISGLATGIVLLALYTISQFIPVEEAMTFLTAGIFGLLTYIAVHAVGVLLEGDGDAATGAAARSGFAAFLYLEVLDASFSFDGVIGAFALSNNLFIIALGLGIGAMFVRSMTIMLVDKGTLTQYRYLEHGAFYAILALAAIMLLSVRFEIPETVTGLIGATLIGLSFWASVRRYRAGRARHGGAGLGRDRRRDL